MYRFLYEFLSTRNIFCLRLLGLESGVKLLQGRLFSMRLPLAERLRRTTGIGKAAKARKTGAKKPALHSLTGLAVKSVFHGLGLLASTRPFIYMTCRQTQAGPFQMPVFAMFTDCSYENVYLPVLAMAPARVGGQIPGVFPGHCMAGSAARPADTGFYPYIL